MRNKHEVLHNMREWNQLWSDIFDEASNMQSLPLFVV